MRHSWVYWKIDGLEKAKKKCLCIHNAHINYKSTSFWTLDFNLLSSILYLRHEARPKISCMLLVSVVWLTKIKCSNFLCYWIHLERFFLNFLKWILPDTYYILVLNLIDSPHIFRFKNEWNNLVCEQWSSA